MLNIANDVININSCPQRFIAARTTCLKLEKQIDSGRSILKLRELRFAALIRSNSDLFRDTKTESSADGVFVKRKMATNQEDKSIIEKRVNTHNQPSIPITGQLKKYRKKYITM